MNHKPLIFLLGFLCLFYYTTAQESCEFRFFPGEINNQQYIYYDGDNVAPFTGWAWVDFNPVLIECPKYETCYLKSVFACRLTIKCNKIWLPWGEIQNNMGESVNQQTERETRTYSGLRAVQAGFCETCILTVYSTTTFSGRIAQFNFKDGFEFVFPFCAHSLRIQCGLGEEEEEEEEQQIEFTPVELTPELSELREFGFELALSGLVTDGRIPSGAYQLTDTISVGQSTNVENYCKFVVHVSDQQGNEFGMDYIVFDDPSNPSLYSYDMFPIV